MLQDSITIGQRHQRFIEIIFKTQIIYALKDSKGFATLISNNYKTEDEDEAMLICFWSEAAMAKALISKEWINYKVEEISLANLLENRCIGMYNDETYAGTNFDLNLFGFESAPLEPALELINEIKKHNYEVPLRNYDSTEEYETCLKQDLEE